MKIFRNINFSLSLCLNLQTFAIRNLFEEFNHLTIYQQIRSFLVLCKILCHFKSVTPSKSMPQKSNHDFKEKHPNIWAGTLEPMRIKDVLTKNVLCNAF